MISLLMDNGYVDDVDSTPQKYRDEEVEEQDGGEHEEEEEGKGEEDDIIFCWTVRIHPSNHVLSLSLSSWYHLATSDRMHNHGIYDGIHVSRYLGIHQYT